MAKMSTPAIPRFCDPFCVRFLPAPSEFLANFRQNAARTDATRAYASLWTAERQVVQQQAFLERCASRRRRNPSTPVKHCSSADA